MLSKHKTIFFNIRLGFVFVSFLSFGWIWGYCQRSWYAILWSSFSVPWWREHRGKLHYPGWKPFPAHQWSVIDPGHVGESWVLSSVHKPDVILFFRCIIAGASALWALAGVTRHQQQRIASMIGINILVDMLMMKSETLQYIAGMAIIALTTENIENQNRVVAGGGVQPLVRLLRAPKTSEKVRLRSFSFKHRFLSAAMICFHRTIASEISCSSLRV